MSVGEFIEIACAAVFAGAAFESGRILVRRVRESKRTGPGTGLPYDSKTASKAAPPHRAVTPGDTLDLHQAEPGLSAAERQAFKNNRPEVVDELVRKVHEARQAQRVTEQQPTHGAVSGTTPRPFAQDVQPDASLRQNLRLKYLYNEVQIDQAIAYERERNPERNLNDLMKCAIERWERDNR